MAKIVGCVKADELTVCQQGMNQHAHILLAKSRGVKPKEKSAPAPQPQTAPPNPSPENSEMDIELLKSVLAMDDKTKAYLLGLDKEKSEAFVKKSAEERKAEVDAHEAEKAKAAAAAAEAEKNKSVPADVASLQEVIKGMQVKLDELTVSKADAAIEARVDAEFAGFPGDGEVTGRERAKSILKSCASLSEVDRKGIEDGMRAQISAMKALSKTKGIAATTPTSANAQLVAKAKSIAEAEKINQNVALQQVMEDPANAELVTLALEEENQAA